MTRDATKDAILVFSVLSGIFTIWQLVELGRNRQKTVTEHQEILKKLAALEKKLA